jgi:hypothetical protein
MATVTTTIDDETGYRTHVVTGELTPEELIEALSRTYADSEYEPGACVLWDVTGAELHLFSRQDIRKIAEFVAGNRKAPPGARSALVVGRALDFGLARMYEQMLVASTDVSVMVFRDIDEARAWLNDDAKEETCP